RVCNDIAPFPNPQVAFNYKVTDRVGVGIAVLGPSAMGKQTWPEFNDNLFPAPQRYMLTKVDPLLLEPTIAVGAEVIDGLRLGAGFIWGFGQFKITNAAAALSQGDPPSMMGGSPGADPRNNDVRALLQVRDYFFPGFTLGALYSPIDNLDIA